MLRKLSAISIRTLYLLESWNFTLLNTLHYEAEAMRMKQQIDKISRI